MDLLSRGMTLQEFWERLPVSHAPAPTATDIIVNPSGANSHLIEVSPNCLCCGQPMFALVAAKRFRKLWVCMDGCLGSLRQIVVSSN